MKKTLIALYITALAAGIYATRNINGDTGDPVHPVANNTHSIDYSIEVYEDGSGVLYKGDNKVHTYDSDFFPWDCETNGNRDCGPTAPAAVQGFKCRDFQFRDQDMNYCTDGTLTWGPHEG